jgi:hypothetical protein
MRIISIITLLLASIVASGSAFAGHYHHGGHSHSNVHFGVSIGVPLFGPWWWWAPPPPVYYGPPVIYSPPVVYRQPVVVAAPAPSNVAVEQTPSHSAPANNGVIELGPAPQANPTPTQPPAARTAPPVQSQTPSQTMANQSQVYVYPRQGQSPQQQAADEAECNRWASTQMGTGFSAEQAASNFHRALSACLDAHGYSVR